MPKKHKKVSQLTRIKQAAAVLVKAVKDAKKAKTKRKHKR